MTLTPRPAVRIANFGRYGHSDALAFVDDVRVRVRRTSRGVVWICDRCGRHLKPTCPHEQQAAGVTLPFTLSDLFPTSKETIR